MINPIDDLLGAIEKFKTNVVNSNELMNLLNKTTKKIGDQETKLHENRKQVIVKCISHRSYQSAHYYFR